jgi:hypothetical protein
MCIITFHTVVSRATAKKEDVKRRVSGPKYIYLRSYFLLLQISRSRNDHWCSISCLLQLTRGVLVEGATTETKVDRFAQHTLTTPQPMYAT